MVLIFQESVASFLNRSLFFCQTSAQRSTLWQSVWLIPSMLIALFKEEVSCCVLSHILPLWSCWASSNSTFTWESVTRDVFCCIVHLQLCWEQSLSITEWTSFQWTTIFPFLRLSSFLFQVGLKTPDGSMYVVVYIMHMYMYIHIVLDMHICHTDVKRTCNKTALGNVLLVVSLAISVS